MDGLFPVLKSIITMLLLVADYRLATLGYYTMNSCRLHCSPNDWYKTHAAKNIRGHQSLIRIFICSRVIVTTLTKFVNEHIYQTSFLFCWNLFDDLNNDKLRFCWCKKWNKLFLKFFRQHITTKYVQWNRFEYW